MTLEFFKELTKLLKSRSSTPCGPEVYREGEEGGNGRGGRTDMTIRNIKEASENYRLKKQIHMSIALEILDGGGTIIDEYDQGGYAGLGFFDFISFRITNSGIENDEDAWGFIRFFRETGEIQLEAQWRYVSIQRQHDRIYDTIPLSDPKAIEKLRQKFIEFAESKRR